MGIIKVQLLALDRTPQQSHAVAESIFQMLLNLWWPWHCDHSLGNELVGKNC